MDKETNLNYLAKISEVYLFKFIKEASCQNQYVSKSFCCVFLYTIFGWPHDQCQFHQAFEKQTINS